MNKVLLITMALASPFSLKYLTKPGSPMIGKENLIKQIEGRKLIATCGGGSHGSDRDPVGGRRRRG